jgi:hypothetical protein
MWGGVTCGCSTDPHPTGAACILRGLGGIIVWRLGFGCWREKDPLGLAGRRTYSLDVLVERLVVELSSSQIFAVLFELEISGRIRALPGKYT